MKKNDEVIQLFDSIGRIFTEGSLPQKRDFGTIQFCYNANEPQGLNVILFNQLMGERTMTESDYRDCFQFARDMGAKIYVPLNQMAPAGLEELLVANEFDLKGRYQGVSFSLSELKLQTCDAVDLIDPKMDDEKKKFTQIYHEAFEVPEAEHEEISSHYFAESEKSKAINRLSKDLGSGEFFGMANGTIFSEFPSIVYGGGAGVINSYRGKGFGKSLLHNFFQELRDNGNEHLAVLAKEDTSLPIILKLGGEAMWSHLLYQKQF